MRVRKRALIAVTLATDSSNPKIMQIHENTNRSKKRNRLRASLNIEHESTAFLLLTAQQPWVQRLLPANLCSAALLVAHQLHPDGPLPGSVEIDEQDRLPLPDR